MKNMNILTRKGSYRGEAQKEQAVRSAKMLGMGAVLLVLSGCSSFNIGSDEYGCPGMPSGVQCMSARDVYSATNDGNVPRPMKPEEVKAKAEADGGGSSDVSVSSSNSGDSVIDNYVAPRLPDRPIPIRTPAQVMRIWVAPWEDTNGDLIVTGYVYTEIEPRRWVIGDGAPQSEPVLRPLQTVTHEPKSETTK
ncbi:type IV conjugative transfer system lipoprotein TraV [Salmonella enterica subsp. enterica serovar 4,[5],12:i:-]|jgi:conjugal transfer pilus assembly protein TraV|uniref:Type IV conjugative transfer system lipoprotein TraV n=7 Tax=Gammaproteobacteria TaxID=1236 RepID=A0A8T3ULW6_ECOLX|nr:MULTISPECIES: type IV conjugative transfer system lipoprotein TraV [Gammaproteobacteria]AZT48772.1 type IV conjugative transfer system protein TraV [Salmonella enterica subsp. enterica serovar Mikawasima]EAC1351287.1 type IV conjugative transfer system protein TraV [Salmonella enterica subsp. enterica serovar Montevideo]EAP4202216.1 type IV conjugative transfer system protein TraV [Salmonella enterica subsp. enterica serovar Poona]EAR0457263.1 type IV conjugative transfer system protein TraV